MTYSVGDVGRLEVPARATRGSRWQFLDSNADGASAYTPKMTFSPACGPEGSSAEVSIQAQTLTENDPDKCVQNHCLVDTLRYRVDWAASMKSGGRA